MGDIEKVNPQLVNTIDTVQKATLTPEITKASGAGKSYQAVAQATAIAVQDASAHLRNITMISSTAMGVAMAQLLATGDSKYAQAIEVAQKMADQAAGTYKTIGVNSADILKGYPVS